MKRVAIIRSFMIAVWMVVSLHCCMPVYAMPTGKSAVSLEELQKQSQKTAVSMETPAVKEPVTASENHNSAIENISGAAVMDEEDSSVKSAGSILNVWGAKAIQMLGYVLSVGICLMVALDMCYIAIPPLRNMLSNGHDGIDEENNPNMPPEGMHPPKDGVALGNLNKLAALQTKPQGTLWVTNAALNAVKSAEKGANVYKIYFKNQLPICILAPTVYVLSATGMLAKIGFVLGNTIAGMIGKLHF